MTRAERAAQKIHQAIADEIDHATGVHGSSPQWHEIDTVQKSMMIFATEKLIAQGVVN